jgi:GNAT superfamily N-acetyltransferase
MSLTSNDIPRVRRIEQRPGEQIKPTTYVAEVRKKAAPNERPIAYLLIQREEQQCLNEKDGSIFEANVRITYSELIPSEFSWKAGKKGWFTASYTIVGNEPVISLTAAKPYASGYVIVEMERLRGERLGTYLMNEIVSWAKRWPRARILPIHLREEQAYKQNKDRRNRFYEQFGIEFDYVDENKTAGISTPMLAANLVNSSSWEANIRELDLHGYMTFLLTESQRQGYAISSLNGQLESLRNSLVRIHAAPLHWAIAQRFPNLVGSIVKLSLFALAIYALAARIR